MLGLTDYQLDQVKRAAAALLPSQRAAFLEALARRLGETPSDGAVQAAIAATLATNRLPAFFCDSKEESGK